jgi:hypothetical protein
VKFAKVIKNGPRDYELREYSHLHQEFYFVKKLDRRKDADRLAESIDLYHLSHGCSLEHFYCGQAKRQFLEPEGAS